MIDFILAWAAAGLGLGAGLLVACGLAWGLLSIVESALEARERRVHRRRMARRRHMAVEEEREAA